VSGHREPRAKRKYQFNMTMEATSETEPVAVPQIQASPAGWGSDQRIEVEEPIEETVAVMMAAGDPDSSVSMAPLADDGNLDAFKSSPKSKGSIDGSGGPMSSRLRTLSVAGWSGLAAVGGVLILMGPASVLTIRLAELGGVWAAITAMILLLSSKSKT
jgi:hypothetical protein